MGAPPRFPESSPRTRLPRSASDNAVHGAGFCAIFFGQKRQVDLFSPGEVGFSLVAKEKLIVLTSTLAEIYMGQGLFEKAREVYERLLSKDPGNDLYRSRVLLLSKDSPRKRKLKILSGLFKAIEERRDERAAIK